MTTLNVNAVEMVNNSVESNNTIMGNIEELTKVFEQEEKELNRLIKSLNGISMFYCWFVCCVLKFQFVQMEGIVGFLTFFYSMIKLD